MEKRKSLADDSDMQYVVIQARILEGDVCRIQGTGPEFNRPYGVALNVESKSLRAFLEACNGAKAEGSEKLQ